MRFKKLFGGRLWRGGVLACLMALGAMVGDSFVKVAFAAFNDTMPCGATWTAVAGGNTSFCEYQCLGGVRTQVRCGTCHVTGGGPVACGGNSAWTCWNSAGTIIFEAACSNLGAGFAMNTTSGSAPLGWSNTDAGSRDTRSDCNCGGSGCGNCDGYCAGGTQYQSGAMCNTGCTCTYPTCVGTGFYSNPGTCGVPTCNGNCHYTSVSSGGGDGTFIWSLESQTCTSMSGCSCPGNPGGPCPIEYGDTFDVACGSPEGTCRHVVVDPPPCTGSCNYTSTSDGAGGYVWSYVDNNCTAGAENCGCPGSPGGACPTATSQNTSVGCGSTGGPCTHTPCSGNCNYKAQAVEGESGVFSWVLDPDHPSDCAAGAPNCGCPADPGGDCPKDSKDVKSVACGSTSVACKKGDCDAHGGDADNDGCCADVDIDDTDSSVCSSDCKGTYDVCEICQKTDPDDSSQLIDCDPTQGTDEEKAACRCVSCKPTGDEGDKCRCRTVNNGDKDKDGCCDAVDKWPLDPKRGCDCCDWYQTWLDSGGAALKTEYQRVFGGGNGPLSQFVQFNSSTMRYESTTPSGLPGWVTVYVPMSWMTGGRMTDRPVNLPVTIGQVEDTLTSLGTGDWTYRLSSVNDFRLWWRLACAWLCGFHLLKYVFQEMRV